MSLILTTKKTEWLNKLEYTVIFQKRHNHSQNILNLIMETIVSSDLN